MNPNPSNRILGGLLLAVLGTVAGAAPTFTPGAQPTGWVARPAVTNGSLASGSEAVFRGDYWYGHWSGDVVASDIDAHGIEQSSSPWDFHGAADVIDDQNYNTGRIIVTYNGYGVPFRWTSLSTTQKASIGDTTLGPKILDFVRGDRSNEDPLGSKFRARTHVLGDILHSSLLYWEHWDQQGSPKRLYVGANDGMLHVLDAADTGDGREVFAYVPSMVIPNLNQLTANPYTRAYFVDGPLSMGRVTLSGEVKTILTGGLGAGGKGLFALDVTNPSPTDESRAAARVKWEISSATTGFGNLGYTYAMPRITRLNDGSTGTAALVVGNGYMNSGTGRAVLYIINLDTGAKLAEIDTGAGSLASPNGLSSPTLVDTNSDGRADYAYAGDLDGNLWKFDLTGSTPANYSVSLLYTTSPAQAITVPPVAYPHPQGGRMVLFATGRLLTVADTTDTTVHYAYGIWDGAPLANTTLLAQTITPTPSRPELRYASTNAPNWSSGGHRGWRTPLPAGERVVGEAPTFNSDRFYFTSTNPTVVNLSPPDGANWLNELSYLTGGNVADPIFDLNGDHLVNNSDLVDGHVVIGVKLNAGVYSQPVPVDLVVLGTTLFNTNPDFTVVFNDPNNRGVSYGHFDFDIYYGMCKTNLECTFDREKHTHEYDDIFDVTGVDMLNASDTAFNLVNAIPGISTPFKILVMNQYLNPAVQLSVGQIPHAGYIPVKTYNGLASQTDAQTLLNNLPTYTRATLNSLEFNLPLDAFESKDWWEDGGIPRAGVMPTQTGCVNTGTTAEFQPGPNGQNHNGALTIQLIKSTTPASALQLNVAGDPRYGWQVNPLKSGKTYPYYGAYVLAEYTIFWHHPNKKCFNDTGWDPSPDPDLSPTSATAKTRAPGSDDPRFGTFGVGDPDDILSITTTVNGNVITTVILYDDYTTYTRTVTNHPDGTQTIVEVFRDGTTKTTEVGHGSLDTAEEEVTGKPRRLNWRELVQ